MEASARRSSKFALTYNSARRPLTVHEAQLLTIDHQSLATSERCILHRLLNQKPGREIELALRYENDGGFLPLRPAPAICQSLASRASVKAHTRRPPGNRDRHAKAAAKGTSADRQRLFRIRRARFKNSATTDEEAEEEEEEPRRTGRTRAKKK